MRLSSSPTLLFSLTIDFVHARVLFVAVNAAFPLTLSLSPSEASSRVHIRRTEMVVKKNEKKKENAKRAFAHTKNEKETDTLHLLE
jgi:hypothetical protein